MKPRYQVAIIGAGRIAAGFDAPSDTNVLTHAHAFSLNSRVHSLGFFDSKAESARAAAAKWGVKAYSSLDALFEEKPQIVVVAVPDEAHAPGVERALASSPKLILCEKPLTTSLEASKALSRKCAEQGVILAVNYQRRYDATVVRLKDDYKNGHLGRPVCGAVLYSKGILHNGSHAVDLLRFLFGEPHSFSVSRKVMDFTPNDPTVAGALHFNDFEVAFQAGNESLYSLFEIDLLFEKARFRFTQSGTLLERYEVRDDPTYPGYRELLPIASGPTGLLQALPAMVNDLVSCLDSGAAPRIAAQAVLNSQAICEAMAKATANSLTSLKGLLS